MKEHDSQIPAGPVKNDNVLAVMAKEHFLSVDECRKLINLRESLQKIEGMVDSASQALTDYDYRKSDIRWLPLTPDTEWVFAKIRAFVIESNKRYNFDITGYGEPLQVATYTNQGHYGWHTDLGAEARSTRKLSVSIQLSDELEYEGGELEFSGMHNIRPPKSIGTVVIFPSFLVHRVRPVIHGTRHSLVAWIHGSSFR
jgi:PKHD-type hydroxylase